MPVSSSWNDITQDASIKEYIGWVWYDREAWIPSRWAGLQIVLRFESAHYNAIAVRRPPMHIKHLFSLTTVERLYY